jgi:hypothetical protein
VRATDCVAATSMEEHDNAITYDFPTLPMRASELTDRSADAGRSVVDVPLDDARCLGGARAAGSAPDPSRWHLTPHPPAASLARGPWLLPT